MLGPRLFEAQPDEAKALYRDTAIACAHAGITVRTGAAEGSDQEAAGIALAMGGVVELVLPWPEFESGWVHVMQRDYPGRVHIEVFDRRVHAAWLRSVDAYHPNPAALSRESIALHARNYGIVEPAEAVVALPPFDAQGGAAQGLRIGRALGRPVYDLQLPEDRRALNDQITALERRMT
jgi:hypothetical protein